MPINWNTHENNLKQIYMKLFGFYRVQDEEGKAEIAQEASILAKDLRDEAERLWAEMKTDVTPATTTGTGGTTGG